MPQSPSPPPPVHVRFGRFELDEARHVLLENGAPVRIGPKPLALLFHLARHRDRVVRKEDLLQAVWPGVSVSEDAVWQVVRKARQALGETAAAEHAIVTVRGVGFRFGGGARDVALAPPGESSSSALEPSASSVVGRESELGKLRASLSRAVSGVGGLVLITGEAGIGKTRLAEELVPLAGAAAAEVQRARGLEAAGTPAFWLWAQVLRGCAESWAPDRLRAALGGGASELARIAPELCERIELDAPRSADVRAAQPRLLDALVRFLKRAARTRAQLVLLDDLQWVDADSLRALAFLADELRRERVLVVATVRDDDLARSEAVQDVLIEWEKAEALVKLPLERLGPDDVRRLVEQQTGQRPSPDVIETLHRRTGGNPFFVRQVLGLAASATGGAAAAAPHAEPIPLRPDAIPLGIRRAASRRLAALSAACRETLEVAAALGPEFPLALLTRAGDCSTETSLLALDEAGSARIAVAPDVAGGPWRFSHDLVREVLLAELPGPRRAALHRQAARALEELHGGHLAPVVPALAYHYAQAAPLLDGGEAVDYAKWAGDLARSVSAYADAAAHYEGALRALDLRPQADPRRRAEILVALGWALQSAGRTTRSREVLRDAAAVSRAVGDPNLFALAALGVAEFFVSLGNPAATALLQEALGRLETESGILRIWVESALAIQLVGERGRYDEAQEHAVNAERAARALGAGRTLAAALLARASVERVSPQSTARLRMALADEACALVCGRGDETIEVMASLTRHAAVMELGERAAADEELERLERLLRRLRSPYWRSLLPMLRSGHALVDGRFAEAEALAGVAFGASELPFFPYEMSLATAIGAVRFHQGRGEEISALLAPLLALHPRPAVALQAARVMGLLEAGRPEEARRGLQAFAREGLEKLVGTDNWTFSLTLLAWACFELEDADTARALIPLLAPRANECVDVSNGQFCAGPVGFPLGLCALACGDLEAADGFFAAALERAEGLRSPVWRAWVRAMQSRTEARRAGGAARARVVAQEARAIAEPLGMARLVQALAPLPLAAARAPRASRRPA